MRSIKSLRTRIGILERRRSVVPPTFLRIPTTHQRKINPKLANSAPLQPNQALRCTIQTDLQSPKSRIQQVLYYWYDKTPPLTSPYEYMGIHSRPTHCSALLDARTREKKNTCKKLLPGRQWRRLGRIRLCGPTVHCGRRQRWAKRGIEKKPRRLRKSMTRGIALAGKVRNWSQKASFQTQSWALPEE